MYCSMSCIEPIVAIAFVPMIVRGLQAHKRTFSFNSLFHITSLLFFSCFLSFYLLLLSTLRKSGKLVSSCLYAIGESKRLLSKQHTCWLISLLHLISYYCQNNVILYSLYKVHKQCHFIIKKTLCYLVILFL